MVLPLRQGPTTAPVRPHLHHRSGGQRLVVTYSRGFNLFCHMPLTLVSLLSLSRRTLFPPILMFRFVPHIRGSSLCRQIVGFCNVPTALVEVVVLFAVFYLKSSVY